MNYDIIIVGGGIVGATAALALAKQTQLTIAVLDVEQRFSPWSPACYEPRVSAISLASQCIFQSLGCWEKIKKKRVSVYTKMQVWDGNSQLHFDCDDIHEASLGHIIEDAVIRESLHETFLDYPSIHFLHPIQLSSMEKEMGKIILQATNGSSYSTSLLIAADGASSWVREQVAIPLKEYDYGHTAIVTTVKTKLPHEQVARQRFLPTGPLAFLPLDDPYRCSIVWSTQPAIAQELMALSELDFCQSMSDAFQHQLGSVVSCERRYVFPLRMRHAKQYVQDNIALIGDAAHTIHPLAGQGVNLGLLDAASLAEVVATAVQKKRDFASLATLRRYERWRKSDNAMMLSSVEYLKQLFESDQAAVKCVRKTGLTIVNSLFFIKNFLMRQALGYRMEMPLIATLREFP